MSDELDSSLFAIEGSVGAHQEPQDLNERAAKQVVDACADFFSDLSMSLRKLSSELPSHLQPWFPQIAGGALYGQVLVVLEGLLNSEDITGRDILVTLGEKLASRVNEAIINRRG